MCHSDKASDFSILMPPWGETGEKNTSFRNIKPVLSSSSLRTRQGEEEEKKKQNRAVFISQS